MYNVRRVHIGKTPQLDELAHECGQLYSKTLVFFWRTVRHKGLWLKPKHLMRLLTSKKLHAHTADATVQAFFANMDSWRQRRKTDPTAHPPRRRKWYFRIEYKRSAMKLLGPVVGVMAPPISIRYVAGVARTEKAYVREVAPF